MKLKLNIQKYKEGLSGSLINWIIDKELRLSCLLYQIAIDKAKDKPSTALNLKGTLEK